MSQAVVDQLRQHVEQHAVELCQRALDVTREQTVQATSRRTGALAAGITTTQPALSGTRVTAQIESAAEYSRWQDEGTGVYGPSGQRIFPTTAKVLVFDWPAAGGVVFARSVAGAPGRHFFHEPMPERWHGAIFESAGA